MEVDYILQPKAQDQAVFGFLSLRKRLQKWIEIMKEQTLGGWLNQWEHLQVHQPSYIKLIWIKMICGICFYNIQI